MEQIQFKLGRTFSLLQGAGNSCIKSASKKKMLAGESVYVWSLAAAAF